MQPFFYILLLVLLPTGLVHSQQRVFAASASNSIFGEAHNILTGIDLSNRTSCYIDTLPVDVGTIALTPHGKLWTIQSNDFGHLYRLDTAMGQVTYVDSFDTHGTSVQSLCALNDSVLLIQCDSDLYGITISNVHSFRIGTVGNYNSGDMTWIRQDLYIIDLNYANPFNSCLVKSNF